MSQSMNSLHRSIREYEQSKHELRMACAQALGVLIGMVASALILLALWGLYMLVLA